MQMLLNVSPASMSLCFLSKLNAASGLSPEARTGRSYK